MQKKKRIDGAVYERNYIYNFHYHLIWVTRYRNPAFTTPELADEMKDILLQLAQIYHTSTDYILGRTDDPSAPGRQGRDKG